jgi:hypothetical protein
MATSRPARPSPNLRILAIGPNGWAVAERIVEHPIPMLVEQAAEELRWAIRSETGRTPLIMVLDDRGRDLTRSFDVN